MNENESAVTTTLVHRIYRGEAQWWQRAVTLSCVVPFDEAELQEFGESIMQVARVGFNAVLVRPARIDLADSSEVLPQFIDRCHRVGLKVLVRLSGSSRVPEIDKFLEHEQGEDALMQRAQAALAAGADGIDLGGLDWASDLGASERFSAFVRLLQAEITMEDSQAIVSASTTLANPAQFHRHLEEDWFHNLRDDALASAPWDAAAIRACIEQSLEDRDRLGHVAAWQITRHRPDPNNPIDPPPGSWDDSGTRTQELAMLQLALALPGAVYLGYPRAGGTLRVDGDHVYREWAANEEAAATSELVSHLLRLRAEKKMGTGSLAFVDGLPWAPPGVLVAISAGVMVVTNFSEVPVAVPPEHRLIAISGETAGQGGVSSYGMTVMPPESCAWFDTARVTAPIVSPGY